MIYVLESILKQKVERLWHKERDLKGADFLVLPGGFSFGDYLRSGAIARFSPIMESVIKHCSTGGFALGVCNGFQVLCEAGLLPGALLRNENQKFICKNTFIKPANTNTAITAELDLNKALKIPIAHGEGRYYAPKEQMKEIIGNNQVIFKYCDEEGNVNAASNPNGSLHNIAGVTNTGRNVFGMMPHPERASDLELGNTDGLGLFESLLSGIPA